MPRARRVDGRAPLQGAGCCRRRCRDASRPPERLPTATHPRSRRLRAGQGDGCQEPSRAQCRAAGDRLLPAAAPIPSLSLRSHARPAARGLHPAPQHTPNSARPDTPSPAGSPPRPGPPSPARASANHLMAPTSAQPATRRQTPPQATHRCKLSSWRSNWWFSGRGGAKLSSEYSWARVGGGGQAQAGSQPIDKQSKV